jgi:hypothetical protein
MVAVAGPEDSGQDDSGGVEGLRGGVTLSVPG